MERSLDSKSSWGGVYRTHASAAEAGLPENTMLHIADPRDLLAIQKLCDARGVSVVCLDANDAVGNDLPLDLLSLCRQLSRVLSPSLRSLLVKSRALDKLRAQLVTASQLMSRAPNETQWTMPLRSGAPRIVAAMGVAEYRAAAECFLQPHWRLLEIGCHKGTSTARLHALKLAAGGGTGPVAASVGVDVSSSIVERARAQHPQVTAFDVADAWDVVGLQRVAARHLQPLASSGQISEEAGPEMLLLDVGGLSGAHGELDTLALLRTLTSTFAPSLKVVVVKSHCLRTIALQFQSGYAVAQGRL